MFFNMFSVFLEWYGKNHSHILSFLLFAFQAQSNAKALEKSMEHLQSEHNKLKLQHEQHKNKV